MKRTAKPLIQPMKLAQFRNRCLFASLRKEDWRQIMGWKADGLLTVEIVDQGAAWVELTPAGHAALAGGENA